MGHRNLVLFSFFLVGACVDGADPLRTVAPTAPLLARATNVSVTDFNAYGNDDLDDTAGIIAAIQAGHNVYIPSGTYYVSETIDVPSATRLYGDGKYASVLKLKTPGIDLFLARGDDATQVTDITVDGLGFALADGVETRSRHFALRAENARNVNFTNNRAHRIGLLEIHSNRDPDPPLSAVRSSNIPISGNDAEGPGLSVKGNQGIAVNFATDVSISNNYVLRYSVNILT